MANTYTQLYLHFVFAVRYRRALISESFRERLEGYLASSTRQAGHHVHALYAMEDHMHMLLRYKVTDHIPDLFNASRADRAGGSTRKSSPAPTSTGRKGTAFSRTGPIAWMLSRPIS